MAFLRLLLAFTLALAIPIQGFAASTCMCRMPQPQGQSGSEIIGHIANPQAMPLERVARNQPAADAAVQAKLPASNPHCAGCSVNCCKATVSPPVPPAMGSQLAHGGLIAYLPFQFAGWAEPVPDKPPRS